METTSHALVSKIALTKTASNYKNIHVSYYLFIEALENLLDFRLYIINNCNLSSVREVVSKEIQTYTFKPIQLQL